MSTLTLIYNKSADRRKQHLDFIGQERRKIIKNAQEQTDLDFKTRAFLMKAERIADVKRLA